MKTMPFISKTRLCKLLSKWTTLAVSFQGKYFYLRAYTRFAKEHKENEVRIMALRPVVNFCQCSRKLRNLLLVLLYLEP